MKQIIFATAFLSLIGPHRGASDEVCLSFDELNAALVDWYGETMVDPGEGRDGHLWASARTGTWTAARLRPDGMACVTAQGGGWTEPARVASLRD